MSGYTTDDRWSCDCCHRSVIITGSEPDTRAAIEAVRDRHRRMHAAVAMPRPRSPMSDERLRQIRNRTATGICPTGKRTYLTRATAKGDAKFAARTGAPGMRPFSCTDCGNWHIGHKPEAVRRGVISASEYYGEGGEQR